MSGFVLREHVTVLLAHGRGRISVEKDPTGWWTVVTDKVSGRRYAATAMDWANAVAIADELARDANLARSMWWEDCGRARV